MKTYGNIASKLIAQTHINGNVCKKTSYKKYLNMFSTFPAESFRLMGESSESGTGRVEILHNGEWGTICDDGWGKEDARVACRQLGFPDVTALQGSNVPSGSGKIWLDDVNCTGTEQNIASCAHDGWGKHDCSHYEDAGVECSTRGKTTAENNQEFEIPPLGYVSTDGLIFSMNVPHNSLTL